MVEICVCEFHFHNQELNFREATLAYQEENRMCYIHGQDVITVLNQNCLNDWSCGKVPMKVKVSFYQAYRTNH